MTISAICASVSEIKLIDEFIRLIYSIEIPCVLKIRSGSHVNDIRSCNQYFQAINYLRCCRDEGFRSRI